MNISSQPFLKMVVTKDLIAHTNVISLTISPSLVGGLSLCWQSMEHTQGQGSSDNPRRLLFQPPVLPPL